MQYAWDQVRERAGWGHAYAKAALSFVVTVTTLTFVKQMGYLFEMKKEAQASQDETQSTPKDSEHTFVLRALTDKETITYPLIHTSFLNVWNLSGSLQDFEVQQGLIYLALGGQGFQIVDMQNASYPQSLGQYIIPGFASEVALVEDIAYVAYGSAGLRIMNVTDPNTPTLIGVYMLSGGLSVTNVALNNNTALIGHCDQEGCIFETVDVTNPSQIFNVYLPCSDQPGFHGTSNLGRDGDFLYRFNASCFCVMNISDPTNPQLIGNMAISGQYAVMSEGKVYVGGSTFQIIDLNNVTHPYWLSNATFPSVDGVVLGTTAYVITGQNLIVMDVSNGSHPQILGQLSMPSYETDAYTFALTSLVIVNNTLAYVTSDYALMTVIDVSNPRHPTLLFTTHEPLLMSLDGVKGFTIGGAKVSSASTAGDINGDGLDDLVLGAPTANNESGVSWVIFGVSTPRPSFLNITTLNATQGFTIGGSSPGDQLGFSVNTAGDINGDGLADLVLGAPGTDNGAGVTYVIWGNQDGFPDFFNVTLISGNGTQGVIIGGSSSGDQLGFSVNTAGDINGDGLADLVLGAPGTDNGAGASYVIFGNSIAWPLFLNVFEFDFEASSSIEIGIVEISQDFSLSYEILYDFQGFHKLIIYGNAPGGQLGFSVSTAGDTNGDGFDEFILGAPSTLDSVTNIVAGASYVMFGNNQGFFPQVSMILGATSFNEDFITTSRIITTSLIRGNLGYAVGPAGDMNGDGLSDLVMGEPALFSIEINTACNDFGVMDTYNMDTSYVILGELGSFPSVYAVNQSLQFTASEGETGTLGFSVSTAGDMNGDGLSDLVLGSPFHDGTGVCYLLWGNSSIFSKNLEEPPDPCTNTPLFIFNGLYGLIIPGLAFDDQFGTSVGKTGNVTGDGLHGVIVTAPAANHGAGVSYVIFGQGALSSFNQEHFRATVCPSTASHIVVVRNRVYVVCDSLSTLIVFDTTSPTNLTYLGSYSVVAITQTGLTAVNDMTLYQPYDNTVKVFNVSQGLTQTGIVKLGFDKVGYGLNSLLIDDGFAYVVGQGSSIVLDLETNLSFPPVLQIIYPNAHDFISTEQIPSTFYYLTSESMVSLKGPFGWLYDGFITSDPIVSIDIAVVNTTAYLIFDRAGFLNFQIVDVQDPSHPQLLGNSRFNDNDVHISKIAVSGTLAYITLGIHIQEGNTGLQLINVSQAEVPILEALGDCDEYWGCFGKKRYSHQQNYDCTSIYLFDIFIQEIKTYTTIYNTHTKNIGLWITEATNVQNPTCLGVYHVAYPTLPGTAKVALSQTTAYLLCGDLYMIDVTDTSSPTLIGFYPVYGSSYTSVAQAIVSLGTTLYLTGQKLLHTLDSSDPRHLQALDVLMPPVDFDEGGALVVEGQTTYIEEMNGEGRVFAINTTDPTQLRVLETYTLHGQLFGNMAVSHDTLYVCDRVSGLYIIPLISKPVVFTPPYPARHLIQVSDKLYLTDTGPFLTILANVPGQGLTELTTYALTSYPLAISADDTYVYVAQGYEGVEVIDVSNATAPVFAAQITQGLTNAQKVRVEGTSLYISDANQKIVVLAIQTLFYLVLTTNQVALVEGQNIPLSCVNLCVQGIHVADTAIMYAWTALDGLMFANQTHSNITLFTQADIKAGTIQVQALGQMPSAYFTVSGARAVSIGPYPFHLTLTVTYPPPSIVRNNLTVNEGQPFILTPSQLAAVDPNPTIPAGSLTLIVGELGSCHFEALDQPGVILTQFEQQAVEDGHIQFVSTIVPGYRGVKPSYHLIASNGPLESAPVEALIDFDAAPYLVANQLRLSRGDTVVMMSTDLQALDPDDPSDSLTFVIHTVTQGTFWNQGQLVMNFPQSAITQGLITFVHDGSEASPAYAVSVKDRRMETLPLPATVQFHQDNTQIANNTSVIAGSVIGGVVGLGVLAAGFFGYRRHDRQVRSRQQGDGFTAALYEVLPIRQAADFHTDQGKQYVQTVQHLKDHLSQQGLDVDGQSPHEQAQLATTIKKALKRQGRPTRGLTLDLLAAYTQDSDLIEAVIALVKGLPEEEDPNTFQLWAM